MDERSFTMPPSGTITKLLSCFNRRQSELIVASNFRGNSVVYSGRGDLLKPSGHDDSLVLSGRGNLLKPSVHGDSVVLSGRGDSLRPSGHGDSLVLSGRGDSPVLRVQQFV